MTFVFASLIVGILSINLSINWIMIIGVARIYDLEVLWYLNCNACLMQLKLILSAYCIFLFQACLNFSVFQIVGPTQNPSWSLKTINLTEFLEGLDIETVTLHGSSLGLVLVMIWIYNSFIVSLWPTHRLPTGLQPDCLHGLRTTLRYVLVHPLSFF